MACTEGPPPPRGGGPDAGSRDAAAGLDARSGEDAGAPDAGDELPEVGPDAAALERLAIVADGTGIQRLEWDGVDLFQGVGGYYVIGSCSGADDAGSNVVSQGSDGRTLSAPGDCPGAPFSMTIEGLHPIRVSIEVGPLPVDYRTLSVPLDPTKPAFDAFAFDGDRYEVGCALSWKERAGSGARFDSIPLPCEIPDLGGVGVARVRPLGAWGEITGRFATIRRRIVSGDAQELAFINHPGTNNIEIGFNANFADVLPAGTVVRLEEEIEVGPPPSVAAVLLPLLTRAILWREPDGAELDAHAPTLDEQRREGMKLVARALLADDELDAILAAHDAAALLEQHYQGLLGRSVDPSGLGTYLSLVEAGEYAVVLDSIIDSPELAALHPEVL